MSFRSGILGRDVSATEDPFVGKLLGGRYRIERLLGRGGMGAVYEALQEDLGRRVAVKVLHPYLAHDADLVARFRREAEAAARLGHANIVQVTDFGRPDDGAVFLVMELLAGAPLSAVIDRDGRLPPERVATIAWQVLSALEAAHRAHLVHRDLKPDNIFLTSVSGVGDVVKLLDFGIAKLVAGEGSGMTATGAVLGTPAYMAPEQARGAPVDARVDLYALGVVMYEALSGRMPYAGNNYNAVIAAILTEDPPGLAELRPDLDPALVAVVERAMARSPDARFDSAHSMREALAPFVHGSSHTPAPLDDRARAEVGTAPTVASTPGRAHPAAPSVQPKRSPRRLPTAAIALLAAAVGGVVVLALTRTDAPAFERAPANETPTAVAVPVRANEAPEPEPDTAAPAAVDTAPVPRAVAAQAHDEPTEPEPPIRPRRRPVLERLAKRLQKRAESLPAAPPRRIVYSGGVTNNRYTVQELREAVGRITGPMTACYAGRELRQYTWALDVDDAGRAHDPRHVGYEHDPPDVRACMREALSRLDFGRPPDGGPGEVRVFVAQRR